MRDVTAVVADSLIVVDGEALEIAGGIVLAPGHEGLWALQWHGGQGELEFADRTSRDLPASAWRLEVKPYVDQWEAQKAANEAEEARRRAEAEAEWNRPENVRARRIEELKSRLSAIDYASMRAVRAIASGTASDADRTRLAELEAQAEEVRADLRALGG